MDSFKYLFEQYYNPLCNYVAHTFNRPNDCEDIVMDVFAHLWSKKEMLSDIQDPKAFLFKSVHNKALEKIRNARLMTTPLDEELNVAFEYKEENADQFILKELIFNSIRHLPSKCQLIFVEAKIEGKSYKQIAAEQNLSIKTIENQMTKALKLIKEEIQKNNNKSTYIK